MLNINTIIQIMKSHFLAGKKILTVTIAIVVIAFTSQAQNTWLQKADFGGTARAGATGFSIGNSGYIGTGGDYPYSNDFWQYDPNSDSWTQKANVGPHGRIWAVGFSIGNKGYIGTGNGSGGAPKDFWEYDPSTNSWTQKADLAGAGRWAAVGFSIGNKGYIATGYKNQCCLINLNDLWEYDPSNDSWTKKANFAGTKRLSAVGFSIGDKGYVGLGSDCDYCVTDDFWEYDPGNDTWTRKADFAGGARENAVAFSVGAIGYVGTGDYYDYYNSTVFNDFWKFDPVTNTWDQIADYGGGQRQQAVGFCIADKGYVGTGGSSRDFWEYTPDTSCTPLTASITPLGNLDICNTGFVKLQASSGNGYTYQWNRNNVDMPGQVYQTLKAKKPGNYRVRISTGPGCAAVSKKVVVYSSCKLNEKTELTSSLSIYPNPTTGTFTLDLQLDDEETSQAEVQIINLLGQTISIESGELKVENGKLVKEIQLNNDAAEGMYLVKVIINNKIFTSQINLQK